MVLFGSGLKIFNFSDTFLRLPLYYSAYCQLSCSPTDNGESTSKLNNIRNLKVIASPNFVFLDNSMCAHYRILTKISRL